MSQHHWPDEGKVKVIQHHWLEEERGKGTASGLMKKEVEVKSNEDYDYSSLL